MLSQPVGIGQDAARSGSTTMISNRAHWLRPYPLRTLSPRHSECGSPPTTSGFDTGLQIPPIPQHQRHYFTRNQPSIVTISMKTYTESPSFQPRDIAHAHRCDLECFDSTRFEHSPPNSSTSFTKSARSQSLDRNSCTVSCLQCSQVTRVGKQTINITLLDLLVI